MANLQEVIHYALAGSRVKPAKIINSRFPEALAALGLSTIFLLVVILGKLGKSYGLPGIKQEAPGV